jgi:5-methylcytosine-specific restriction endonuclease McrA
VTIKDELTGVGTPQSRFTARNLDSERRRLAKWQREFRKRAKLQAYVMLGGKCVACGITDVDVLQIDHIVPIRRKRGMRTVSAGTITYTDLVRGKLDPKSVQILCANCHVKKTKREFFGKYRE